MAYIKQISVKDNEDTHFEHRHICVPNTKTNIQEAGGWV